MKIIYSTPVCTHQFGQAPSVVHPGLELRQPDLWVIALAFRRAITAARATTAAAAAVAGEHVEAAREEELHHDAQCGESQTPEQHPPDGFGEGRGRGLSEGQHTVKDIRETCGKDEEER